MKKYLCLAALLLIVSCIGHQPAAPPPPPGQVNGFTEQAVAAAVSPQESKTFSDQSEKLSEMTAAADAAGDPQRPPFRPRVPFKCAGPYAMLGDPKIKAEQWDKVGKDLYDAGYNQISMMINLDVHMHVQWPKVNGKFDYSKIIPAWKQYIKVMIERMQFWRQTPRLKFVDQYHDKAGDPYVQGLGFDNVEALYSSWDGHAYRWISWEENQPHHYTNFKPTNAFGRGMFLYVQAVVDAAKEVRDMKLPNGKPKYPDFKIVFVWANETMALFPAQGSHPIKTRGDRDEISYWIIGLMQDAGFVLNKNFWFAMDYLAFRPSIKTVDYKTMASVSRYLTKRGWRLEIHGIKTVGDVSDFTEAGVNDRTADFSTDGDLRLIADGKGLFATKKHTDLKVDCAPGQPCFPDDAMMFWNHYFPPYGAHKISLLMPEIPAFLASRMLQNQSLQLQPFYQ